MLGDVAVVPFELCERLMHVLVSQINWVRWFRCVARWRLVRRLDAFGGWRLGGCTQAKLGFGLAQALGDGCVLVGVGAESCLD